MARPTPNLQKDIHQVIKICKLSHTKLKSLSDYKKFLYAVLYCIFGAFNKPISGSKLLHLHQNYMPQYTVLSLASFKFSFIQGNVLISSDILYYFLNCAHS